MLFIVFIGAVFELTTLASSLAIFETKILEFSNPMNKTSSNACCQSSASGTSCPLACLTVFELCLDDLHLDDSSCMFGRARSRTFLQSSLRYNDSSLDRWLNISTSLSWPGYFGIHLLAKDNSSILLPSKGLILSSVFVENMIPGLSWRTKWEHGSHASMRYQYRVHCATNYYGKNCTVYCKPRDDEHGHYGCNDDGGKYCLPGWNNLADYCKTPICLQPCQHGTCSGPNICSCTTGWSGHDCSVCETRLGCVNGTCTVPGGCDCNAGWGGNNCDKETDYCGLRKPCWNGGTCVNRGMGNYKCFCHRDFTGRNCETDLNPCNSGPCQNRGTCQVTVSGYKCICGALYTGANCETKLNLCASHYCQNNGTCLVSSASPSCQCKNGYAGPNCESQIKTPILSSIVLQATRSEAPSSMYHSKHRSQVKGTEMYTNVAITSSWISQETTSASSIVVASTLQDNKIVSSSKPNFESAIFSTVWSTSLTTASSYRTSNTQETTSRMTRTLTKPSIQISFHQTQSAIISSKSEKTRLLMATSSSSSFATRKTVSYQSSRSVISSSLEPTALRAYLSTSSDNYPRTSALGEIPDVTTQSSYFDDTLRTSIDAATSAEALLFTTALIGGGQKVELKVSSRRSLAIGISVSISFVILIIVASIFIWSKMSKRRGALTFRRTSSIIPASANNPCHLIDAGYLNRGLQVNNGVINNNFDSYQISHTESSSRNSDHSQAISSKDICIEHNMLHTLSSSDKAKRFYNECYMNPNYGYLSEGTSGYGSENSSGRSSATCSCRPSKSPLSTDGIIITKALSYSHKSEDLPNCVVYQEEQL